ncbi:RNA exonuclease complex component [Scheffersomyces xylosifermentans]|uniref:RNA exonuclease complex component n=1 Tax=Scheffersomyces xylosifermentans TaxID=1304137 RepID=UPI00315C5F16
MLTARRHIVPTSLRLIRYHSKIPEKKPWLPSEGIIDPEDARTFIKSTRKTDFKGYEKPFSASNGRRNFSREERNNDLPKNLLKSRKVVIPDSLRGQYKPFDFSNKSTTKKLQKTKTNPNRSSKQGEDDLIEDSENKQKIQAIVRNSNRTDTEFFNPSNQTLDLRLNNKTLFEQIRNSEKDRMSKRYSDPSEEWLKIFKTITTSKITTVKKSISKAIKEASISTSNVHRALAVGDLVVFSDDSILFAIVVAAPKSIESQMYTFVDSKGEVIFGSANSFAFRFPGVIPKEHHELLGTFVQLEKKYLDVPPVGLTNMEFSKSNEALPKELQVQDVEQHVSALSDGINFSESTDFVVAQATSQLLTNSDVNTYIIPTAARSLYTDALTSIGVEVFNEVSKMKSNLEILHKRLQFDENGDLINTPRPISIFEILNYLEDESSWNKLKLESTMSSLGKPLETDINFTDRKYSVTKYLALISSLRRQSRNWNIIYPSRSTLPVSATILPISRNQLIHRVLSYLKDGGDSEFATYCIEKAEGKDVAKPQHYYTLVQLFKDYIIGNFSNDLALEAALASIIRMVDTRQKHPENADTKIKYSYEYSKARAYDMLNDIGAIETAADSRIDPIHWSNSLNLPGHNVSAMSDASDSYFKYVDSNVPKEVVLEKGSDSAVGLDKFSLESFNKEETLQGVSMLEDFNSSDPLESIREDFGDVPIYCIDSEDAHEVDDGISIHTNGDNYVLTVHVANPTSYINSNSTINSIAFGRASTSYVNEGPFFMFPELITKLSALGEDGKQTRTYSVEYQLNKSLVDEFILQKLSDSTFKPSLSLCEQIMKQIDDSVKVKFRVAKNFPIGFTYNKVNEVLSNKSLVQSYKENNCGDEHFSNLFKLHNISTILRQVRHQLGGAFDNNSDNLKIKLTQNNHESGSNINIKDRTYSISPQNLSKSIQIETSSADSNSVDLVTEFMLFANYSSAKFAKDNGINFVYRTQDRSFPPELVKELENKIISKLHAGEQISLEAQQVLRFFSRTAALTTQPEFHDGIGIDKYGWVTSPLRRYVDVLNHWSIADFLLGKESHISERTLKGAITHIQSKGMVEKKMQTISNKFWLSLFFKEYTNRINDKASNVQPITFRLIVVGRKSGFINVELSGFGVRGLLEVTPKFLEDYTLDNIHLGDVLESDRFRVSRMDFIEDTLEFVYI